MRKKARTPVSTIKGVWFFIEDNSYDVAYAGFGISFAGSIMYAVCSVLGVGGGILSLCAGIIGFVILVLGAIEC